MLRRALISPPVLISLIVVLVASTLPLYVSGYVLGLLTIAYYFGVFSMAWDLLFGFANEVNFGPSFLIGLDSFAMNAPVWLLTLVGGALADRADRLGRGRHEAVVQIGCPFGQRT